MAHSPPNIDEATQRGARAALAALRAAMVPDRGPVAELEGELLYKDRFTRLTHDGFAFSTPGGARFSYRLGERVKVDCPHPELAGECALYLWGTVFGAIAWLNRLVPLHCSAISLAGRSVAFTAPSGGGKSTMAAALVKRGYAHLCDDTLVLSLSGGRPCALPDGKPAKLWGDAASMLSVSEATKIDALPGKFYVQPRHASDQPVPLRDIVWLKKGDKISLAPVTGSAKFERLPELFYRGFIHSALGDRDFHARAALTLASKVRFWELTRPVDGNRFDRDFDMIVKELTAAGILPR